MDVTHERDVQWYTHGLGIHLYTVLCWSSIIHLLLAIVVGIYIHIYLCILSKQYCSIIQCQYRPFLCEAPSVKSIHLQHSNSAAIYTQHFTVVQHHLQQQSYVYSMAALTSHTHPMLSTVPWALLARRALL